MIIIYAGNTIGTGFQYTNYLMVPDIFKEFYSVENEDIVWTNKVWVKRKKDKKINSLFLMALKAG